ncbi:MAG: DUF2188 domain-containing protein [Treponema sp.]|nr:DUF2188 domain-containing protein [Treponema sp.]
MPNPNNRTVYQTPDGDWANKKNGNSRPSKLYDTQKDAIADAQLTLIHQKIKLDCQIFKQRVVIWDS